MKTRIIALRLTPPQIEYLQAESKRRKMTLSDIIRDLMNDARDGFNSPEWAPKKQGRPSNVD
jgi:hypothetical protein